MQRSAIVPRVRSPPRSDPISASASYSARWFEVNDHCLSGADVGAGQQRHSRGVKSACRGRSRCHGVTEPDVTLDTDW